MLINIKTYSQISCTSPMLSIKKYKMNIKWMKVYSRASTQNCLCPNNMVLRTSLIVWIRISSKSNNISDLCSKFFVYFALNLIILGGYRKGTLYGNVFRSKGVWKRAVFRIQLKWKVKISNLAGSYKLIRSL